MPSVHTSSSSGGNVNEVSATVNSRNVPIGGSLLSLGHNESYVVPAGYVLLLTLATGNDGTATTPEFARFLINGELVAMTGPTDDITPSTNPLPQSQAIDLRFEAGQTLSVLIYRGNTTNALNGPGALVGYLVPLVDGASAGDNPYLHEHQASTWWAPSGILMPVARVSDPVRAVPLGDGKALLIRGEALDSTTTVLDIETGVETQAYTGDESFDITDYAHLKACYQTNYSAGKSIVRVIASRKSTSVTSAVAARTGGHLAADYVIEMLSGNADSDFRVRLLGHCVLGTIVDGRSNNTAGYKVLGWAGVDYIVTVNLNGLVGLGSSRWLQQVGDLDVWNIAAPVPVKTTLITQAAGLGSSKYVANYYGGNSHGSGDAGCRGIPGKNGRLYVYLGPVTVNQSNVLGTDTIDFLVAVVSSTGTLAGSLKTTGVVIDSAVAAGNLIPFPPMLGLTEDALGSERLIALQAWGVTSGMRLRQNHWTFNAGGTPTLAVSHTLVPGEVNTHGDSATFQAAQLPSGTVEAPVATRLGSYFNHLGNTGMTDMTDGFSANSFPKGFLHGAPAQDRRTGGLFHGTPSGASTPALFYPTGMFVEKRSRTGFASLVGNGVVPTNVPNPIQAIASASKLLVVGVSGAWEILTP